MKCSASFAVLLVLTLGACQNNNSNQSPTTDGSTTDAPLPKLDVKTISQTLESAKTNLQAVDNLEKKIEALPENVKNQRKEALAGIQVKIQSLQTIEQQASDELNNLIYTVDANGQKVLVDEIKPGKVPNSAIQNAPIYIESIKSCNDLLGRLEQQINAIQGGN
jgi:hypothetical protein